MVLCVSCFLLQVKPETDDEGYEHWQFEAWLGRRVRPDGTVHCKVKWKGCPENQASWASVHDLTPIAKAEAKSFDFSAVMDDDDDAESESESESEHLPSLQCCAGPRPCTGGKRRTRSKSSSSGGPKAKKKRTNNSGGRPAKKTPAFDWNAYLLPISCGWYEPPSSGGMRRQEICAPVPQGMLDGEPVHRNFAEHWFDPKCMHSRKVPIKQNDPVIDPFDSVKSVQGATVELFNRRSERRGKGGGFNCDQPNKEVILYDVAVSGPGLPPISLKEKFEEIAGFQCLPPTKVAARMGMWSLFCLCVCAKSHVTCQV